MNIESFKLFFTIMASAIAATFRKPQPVSATRSVFTALVNGIEKIQSQALAAYHYKDYLHLQVSLPGQIILTMHLHSITGTGIYEFAGYSADNLNLITLEQQAWLGQVYTSNFSAGGGYIEIISLTPYVVEATFSIKVALEAPDFNIPIAITEFTRGYLKVPFTVTVNN